MRKLKKLLSATLAVCMLASMTAMNAFAAEDRTKISSVKLKVESNISVGDDNSDVTVSTTTGNITVDDYSVTNDNGEWNVGDTPKIEVTLSADSDYYFYSITKSNVSVSGSGSSVYSVKTTDNKSTLVVTVKLDKLTASSEDLDVDGISWDEDSAVGTWDENTYASKYEVKLYRGSSTVMSTVTTTDTSYDFSSYITKTGTYTFKVRGVYSTKKGTWNESEDWDVDTDLLSSVGTSSSSPSTGSSSGPNSTTTSGGAWLKDSVGWWYCNADRSYTISNWQKINNIWYYFNSTGYMVTGWVQTNGKWYYCGSDGAMWVSRTTPDGYKVDASGAWVQ